MRTALNGRKRGGGRGGKCRGGYRCSGKRRQLAAQAGGATAKLRGIKTWEQGDDAVPGLLKIMFNSGGPAAAGFTSDTVGDDDAEDPVKPNAKQTNVGGDFPHMFDISSEGARVLVFTDKEQDTPGVKG